MFQKGDMWLRMSAVQYHLHDILSFDEFARRQVEHYVKTAQEFNADFIVSERCRKKRFERSGDYLFVLL